MDSTYIQLSYDNSTDTIRYLYPNPTTQLLYDRNGSYIPQNRSIPYIGAVWTNITITNSTGGGCSCIPSSILITQSTTDTGLLYIQQTVNASNCSNSNFTVGTIFIPNLQLLQWTGSGTSTNTTNVYVFDPYNSLTELTIQIMNGSISGSICEYSAQRFTDFTPLDGTWYLDWQSQDVSGMAPEYIQAIPGDNDAYISTYLNSSLGVGNGYLIGGPNNQYFDSSQGIGFTYNEQTNTLLGFSTFRFPFPVLFSPNGNLISNTFIDSNWTSLVLTNGSSVPTTCCIPNTIHLTPSSYNLIGEYEFDQDYESNPACQTISQDITDNPFYVVFRISTPSINELLWTDGFSSIISFANATTTSEITVQNFMGQTQCSFNMAITSNPGPTPLSANFMGNGIVYFMIGLFMMLTWA